MEEKLLKLVIMFLSVPFVLLARITEARNVWGIRFDIKRCVDVIDSTELILPVQFFTSLIAAEDHRNTIHRGVDPIAVFRAVCARVFTGHVQGASTIEQQFVRVISGRYERTIARKIYEQALAVAVSRRRSKSQIAIAYLSVAYYGSASIGAVGLRSQLGNDLHIATGNNIREMIARLKYPEPSQPSAIWQSKIYRRVKYIISREDHSARSYCGRPARHVAVVGRVDG